MKNMNDVKEVTHNDIIINIATNGQTKVALVPCNIDVKSYKYLNFMTFFSTQAFDNYMNDVIKYRCNRELGMRPKFYVEKSIYEQDGEC